MKNHNFKQYDIWIVDPHGKCPWEKMGHLMGVKLAEHFASKQKRVLFITSNFSHILKEKRSNTTKYITGEYPYDLVLLKTNSYKNHVGFLRIIWHLNFTLSFLKEFKKWGNVEHISISHPLPFFENILSYVKKKTNSKVIIYVRDLWPEIFKITLPKFLKKFDKLIFSFFYHSRSKSFLVADGLSFVSKSYLHAIEKLENISHKKTKVIYHAFLDKKNFLIASDFKFTKGPETKLILNYSGTLGSGYDLESLIEALKEIQKTIHANKIKLFVSGKGPNEEIIKAAEKELGKSIVEYLGILDYKDLMSLYRYTDVGCLPYVSETTISFPAKVFDYIAVGKPVIHSIDGELRDLFDKNNCGIYFNAGNVDVLKNALLNLLEDDGKKLQKMSLNMRNISQNFTTEKTLENMYNFYIDVVSK